LAKPPTIYPEDGSKELFSSAQPPVYKSSISRLATNIFWIPPPPFAISVHIMPCRKYAVPEFKNTE
jgi:hypothetical protein